MKKSRTKSVDLNLFKVFAAVYNLKNLTHAGEQLALTQPAVSRSLDRLHHLFNERLFIRTEGEMRPTRTAEMLAPLILEGLAMMETAVATSVDFNPQELAVTLKLGGNDYVSSVILPSLVARLSKSAPSVFLATIPCTYLDASNLLQRNVIDCAITSSLPSGERMAAQPLFREDYAVISAIDHPMLKDGHALDLETYLSCEHILVSYTASRDGWVDERLAEMGRRRRVIASTHMFLTVPHIIHSTPYLCTLPRRLAMQFAKAHPIRVSELPFESQTHLFHLVWPRHQSRNPISTWLRGQILDTCAELGESRVLRAA